MSSTAYSFGAGGQGAFASAPLENKMGEKIQVIDSTSAQKVSQKDGING
jgi:hypothetical protein